MPLAPPPVVLSERQDFALGALRIRPSTRRIDGPAQGVDLEPRMMQVLVALADAGGGVVSRDLLVARCWDGTVVGDDAVHRAIAGVRRGLRAAGSVGGKGVEVETIPKVGYKLVAPGGFEPPVPRQEPVETAASESGGPLAPGGMSAPAQQLPPASAGRRRLLWVAGALGGSAAAGLAWWSVSSARSEAKRLQALFDLSDSALREADPAWARQAVEPLRDAVLQAPTHAQAWGRLALALRQGAEFAPPGEMAARLGEVRDAAQRALALDARQPHARTALALLQPTTGNWGSIHDALRQVLDEHPDHAPALDALSLVLSASGMLAEHYPLRLRTVALDPLHAGYAFRSIYAHWMNDRLVDADRAGARALELRPAHLATWMARIGVLGFTGRADRALEMLGAPAPRPMLPPPLESLLRGAYSALVDGGATARAAAADAVATTATRGGPLMAVTASLHLAALGDVERALQFCEAFLLERGPVMAGPVWAAGQAQHVDVRRRFTSHLFLPVMAPVREMPGFAVLMRDLGLVDFWRATGRRPDYLGSAPLP
ncbi:winged helix-turn-helix domain-containing protein [Paucibacter sp. M5-1]|uniref:winged helix-turn-helix domain-containing protein n=1 Tax=Paucibacter sp. M5-1 TaxID=3015998 RepID=UPI0022B88C9E|nr:winged helix-turn-helix domain-containing protein [Paucibacter sp. M5-1]MCZ7880385.1 winged helix-turn-helix domain-containing protein [Paucibacter sp. M5-1]